jgi:hypothetical protein
MKSPNNTTDIPDVLFVSSIDHGLRPAKAKIGKIDVREKEFIAQDTHRNAHVLKGEKDIRNMMKEHIIDLTQSFIIFFLLLIVLKTANVLDSLHSFLELENYASVAPHDIVPFQFVKQNFHEVFFKRTLLFQEKLVVNFFRVFDLRKFEDVKYLRFDF